MQLPSSKIFINVSLARVIKKFTITSTSYMSIAILATQDFPLLICNWLLYVKSASFPGLSSYRRSAVTQGLRPKSTLITRKYTYFRKNRLQICAASHKLSFPVPLPVPVLFPASCFSSCPVWRRFSRNNRSYEVVHRAMSDNRFQHHLLRTVCVRMTYSSRYVYFW